MPYLLLAIGLGFGIYGLYRFFVAANTRQIYALALSVLILVLAAALFYLAVTGKLAAAVALLAALLPVIFSLRQKPKNAATAHDPDLPMTRADAFAVLDLPEDADHDAIDAAYKKLMKKVHPDQEGSTWIAAKLNQARDLLLK